MGSAEFGCQRSFWEGIFWAGALAGVPAVIRPGCDTASQNVIAWGFQAAVGIYPAPPGLAPQSDVHVHIIRNPTQ